MAGPHAQTTAGSDMQAQMQVPCHKLFAAGGQPHSLSGRLRSEEHTAKLSE